MPRNIEIKARIGGIDAIAARVAAIADSGPTAIHQDDTFFAGARGRLKLRAFSASAGELIFYRRADQAGPKESFFLIVPTAEPDALREVLTLVDRVEGLGEFLELEVVLADGEHADAGVQEARRLMAALNVTAAQLVDGAYVDLLEQRTGDGERPSPEP
jgi:adenylate cyclase class IV